MLKQVQHDGGVCSTREALNQTALLHGGFDEAGEQGMRLEWAALEFGMELHADEPGMVWSLYDFGQLAIG